MNIEQFKKEKNENAWFYSPDGDFEIFIKGNETEPDQDSYELVEKLMSILEECKAKAIHLLESFMKDEGIWHLCTASFVEAEEHKGCAFTLDFGFESNSNRHEYNYTGFLVCFSWPLSNPAPLNEPHPFKFVVEFS
ncbi:MAG: hypothetical protein AB2704_13795 [Candidatus Thiodiazotropha taylori]